jgi:hypothetical protein
MSCSLPIIVFTTGTRLVNNLPFFNFDSELEMHEFVLKLRSRKQEDIKSNGYFILKEPEKLPEEIRQLHMHEVEMNGRTALRDGTFCLYENIELIKKCRITDFAP